jgi:hypothetical protein
MIEIERIVGGHAHRPCNRDFDPSWGMCARFAPAAREQRLVTSTGDSRPIGAASVIVNKCDLVGNTLP